MDAVCSERKKKKKKKKADKIAAMICICPEQQYQPLMTSPQTDQANYTLWQQAFPSCISSWLLAVRNIERSRNKYPCYHTLQATDNQPRGLIKI